MRHSLPATLLTCVLMLGLIAQAATPNEPVPSLPFPDQQDPSVCGIPTVWGSNQPGWLDGHYRGTLWQPRVFLYEGHARQKVVGSAPTGSRVKILLYQANPVLSFYLVRTLNTGLV